MWTVRGVHLLEIPAKGFVTWLVKHDDTKLVKIRKGEQFFRLDRINRIVLKDLPKYARFDFKTNLKTLDALKQGELKPCRQWAQIAVETYRKNILNSFDFVGDSIDNVDIIEGGVHRIECKYIGGMLVYGGKNPEPNNNDRTELLTICDVYNVEISD